jgi:hypothetical protein
MTDAPPQLTIDGDEEARRETKALTQLQQRILARIRDTGQIRSVEAGRMVHEARGKYCASHGGARAHMNRGEDSLGCCAYASADGLDAMKRLTKRGLVKKVSPGIWVAP